MVFIDVAFELFGGKAVERLGEKQFQALAFEVSD